MSAQRAIAVSVERERAGQLILFGGDGPLGSHISALHRL